MSDATKAKIWEIASQSFGDNATISGTSAMNLRFPGQYYDQETGLNYNYFRDYNPAIGRYIQKDPIGFKGGINLYAYTENNPVNWIDPTGLAGVGAGFYFVAGAEASNTVTTCCEGGSQYEVTYLTVCGGAGIGGKGGLAKGAASGSGSFLSISSQTGCPTTRYYGKHENTFIARSGGRGGVRP